MVRLNGVQLGRPFPFARKQNCLRAIGLGVLLGWSWLAGFVSANAQALREPGTEQSKWEVFSGCRLMTNQIVDGDSFHVLHKNREYIFRLYFVDAPESTLEFKDRIQEQALFFGISSNDVTRAGALAARFTREKLTGKDITVIMRHQNAMGRSSLPRYYAVVLVNGENLAEGLVANGLARIHAPRANWPDGPKSTIFVSHLKNLELAAKEKRIGIWNQSAFPLETEAVASGTNNATIKAASGSALVDINTATFEELQKLPGIGRVLAERIIAHRPYGVLKDLDAVPGIGPATVKRLEPLIRISNPSP